MAQQTAHLTDTERRLAELMAEFGLDRTAAALVVAVERGDAMVDDVVFDPPMDREELYRRGITMPIKDRIALARRQIAEEERAQQSARGDSTE